jgi:bifunctional DNA-binding transcriptional regulator/antitoxin component of YhaV-PrlF toxin-antitoxin module
MRVTSKGQVTIPIEIRGKAGILPNMVKKQPRRGKDLIKQMRGRGTVRMTTDEIMALTRNYRTYFPRLKLISQDNA